MRRFFDLYGFRTLNDGEGGGGGGGGGAPPAAPPKPKRQTNPLGPSALLARAQGFIAMKGGDAESAVMQLLRENKQLRDAQRDGGVPAGHVVITDAEAKELGEFRAVGKKPAELKKISEEHGVLLEFKTTREHTDQWREVAKLAGWNPDVLLGLREVDNLVVEFKTEKVTDQTTKKEEHVRVPYVKPRGDDKAQAMPIADYAKQNLAPYMGALQGNANGDGKTGTGFQVPKMGSTDQGSGGDLVTKRLEEQQQRAAATPNPFMATPAKT